MFEMIEFDTADGKVYVEVGAPQTGDQILASADAAGLVGKATQSFEDALKPVPKAIKTVLDAIAKSELSPNELEVEFGIKFTADAGVVISKVGGEASLTVTATWKKAE